MIAYASRTGTKRNLAALREAGWRIMVSAAGPLRPEGFRYALDNGAWTAHRRGHPFDAKRFERALSLLGRDADFVVLPDVVCGGHDSLDLSLSWLPSVSAATRLVLLPVQNGVIPSDVEWMLRPDLGIFVGGDDEYKEATMAVWGAVARRAGTWCHVGRVKRRILLCQNAGVDSFDGSGPSRYAKCLARLDRGLRQGGLVLS